MDFAEDLFSPCAFTFDLSGLNRISIIASTERREVIDANNYREAEIERRLRRNRPIPGTNKFVTTLTAAADQFVVTRRRGATLIAGYHWFADWGRDRQWARAEICIALA